MTQQTERDALVEELRECAIEGVFNQATLNRAADLLEAQAQRIAKLEDRIDDLISEEHSVPELRNQVHESFLETPS